MAAYSIGEVEALTGLPATTLRHWESVVPLLSPRKDGYGRRVYGEADLRLVLRLRHLALDLGLGIGAAAEALLAEASVPGAADLSSRLAEIRGDLITLYFENRRSLAVRGQDPGRGGDSSSPNDRT